MNKKSWNIIIILVIVTIVIVVLNFMISLRTYYLGNYTKVISIGSKIIKLNSNRAIKLRKVKYYRNGSISNGFLKSYYIDGENEYYIVSKNNKSLDILDLIAAGPLVKMDIVPPKNIDEDLTSSSLKDINSFLGKTLSDDDIFGYKKITYDIDNDSNNEDVIYLSYMENNSLKKIAYISDEVNTEIINKETDLEDEVGGDEIYSLVDLIDFNGDNIYEIVISRCAGDDSPTYYDIYSYDNGIIKEIK